jgi:hypothetical protein
LALRRFLVNCTRNTAAVVKLQWSIGRRVSGSGFRSNETLKTRTDSRTKPNTERREDIEDRKHWPRHLVSIGLETYIPSLLFPLWIDDIEAPLP